MCYIELQFFWSRQAVTLRDMSCVGVRADDIRPYGVYWDVGTPSPTKTV